MKRFIGFLILLSICLSSYSSEETAFQLYYRGEYAKSASLLLEQTQKNNAKALYLLANMKLYGYGQEKNISKGIEDMHLAAEKNNLDAQMFLGAYYLNDKKEIKNALFWLEKAANQGNASAELFVALCYLHGIEVKKNIEIARKYLIKAAQHNIPMAQFELGKLFLESRHAKDRKMGAIWLNKAKINHYSGDQSQTETSPTAEDSAQSKILSLLKTAKIVIENPKRPVAKGNEKTEMPVFKSLPENQLIKPDYTLLTPNNISVDYIINQVNRYAYDSQKNNVSSTNELSVLPKPSLDEFENLQTLSREVELGHHPAMYKLALLYANGDGVTKDERKALDLFYEAAKAEYVKAEYAVGLYCLNGWVVEKSMPHALYWLRRAAMHGSANAQLLLGHIYEFEIKDLSSAKAMYSLAAQSGSSLAQYNLAQMYASGLFNPTNNDSVQKKDLALALKLYKKATEKMPQAEIYLSYFYLKKNQPKENQAYAFRIAAEYGKKGNEAAKLLLAILYDRGIGVDKNASKAFALYQSLSNYNALSKFMLGTQYYLKNHQESLALQYLDQSAKEGNIFAQYNLAIIAKKNNDPETNFLMLLKKSANGNFDKASLLLADHYLENADQNSGTKEAAMIYQQLAEKQNAAAQLRIGYLYQKGIYYEKNDKKALEWYHLSAAEGNAIAQYKLGEAYQFGLGVPRNLQDALAFYEKSAQQDFTPAMVAIGYIMQVDMFKYNEAKRWYEKAIQFNNQQAEENLALLNKYSR